MLSLAFFGRGWVPLAMAGRVAEGGFGSGGGGVRTLFSACDAAAATLTESAQSSRPHKMDFLQKKAIYTFNDTYCLWVYCSVVSQWTKNSVDVARACICVLEAGAEAGGVGLNIASAEAPTWVRKTPFSSQFILKLVILKTKTGSGQA